MTLKMALTGDALTGATPAWATGGVYDMYSWGVAQIGGSYFSNQY